MEHLKEVIHQVNDMSEKQRTASKAFFARTLELNRDTDDLKKKHAEIHSQYSDWKQDVCASLFSNALAFDQITMHLLSCLVAQAERRRGRQRAGYDCALGSQEKGCC